jgi:hypothetical protein
MWSILVVQSPENVGDCFLCGSGCIVDEEPIDLWPGLNDSVSMEENFIDIRNTNCLGASIEVGKFSGKPGIRVDRVGADMPRRQIPE